MNLNIVKIGGEYVGHCIYCGCDVYLSTHKCPTKLKESKIKTNEMITEAEKIKIVLQSLIESIDKKYPILKEYTDQQTQEYYAKKEMGMPDNVNIEGLKKIVNRLNTTWESTPSKTVAGCNATFEYSMPYADSADKYEPSKHQAIKNKWWAIIPVTFDNGISAKVKFVNVDGSWKYYNHKIDKPDTASGEKYDGGKIRMADRALSYFFNQSGFLKEARNSMPAYISSEDGVFKLSENEKNILKKLLEEFSLGLKRGLKVTNPQYFHSGYKGISFSINFKDKFFLIYNPGKVGLENHTVGGVSLQRNGQTVVTYSEDDDKSRSFGDVAIKNINSAYQKLKEYAKTL